jgi:hypothetical protein
VTIKFSYLHRGTLELCQSDHQVPSPPIAKFGWAALGRVLIVENVVRLRMMEATVYLGTFNIAEIVWYPSPYQHNPVSELYRPFL